MDQLNIKAFWHYYRIINIVNLVFSIMIAFFAQKAIWLPIVFSTIGIGAGILFFNYYFSPQYYFYHNLGYTRKKLALNTFCINLPLGVILLIIILLA